MSNFNFPLLFIVVVTVFVSVLLLILSDLPVWSSFLIGFAAAVVGLLIIDLIIILAEKHQSKRGKLLYKSAKSRKGQKGESLTPLHHGTIDISLPKAPEGLSCPSCNSSDIAVILYGQPALSEEIETAIAERQVTLGGCLVYDGAPQWVCNACSSKFGELRISQGE